MAIELQETTVDKLAAFVERSDLERMRVVTDSVVPALLKTGAVTFGDRVFFRSDKFNEGTPKGLALIAHESRHVGQYQEMGIPLFLLRYLLGLLRSGFSHKKHPMEVALIEEQGTIEAALAAL